MVRKIASLVLVILLMLMPTDGMKTMPEKLQIVLQKMLFTQNRPIGSCTKDEKHYLNSLAEMKGVKGR